MTIDERAFRLFMAVVAAAMFVWAAAYGYLNYKTDNCTTSVETRLNNLQLRIQPSR
jgi:hypothetical protein